MACKEVESVRVAVRCRPLSDDEKAGKYESIVAVDQLRGQITVHVPNARTKEERERSFLFDSVFGADAKQTDVYNETSRPIADAVLEGYNGTIFAYGQTGTGKTFTMAGKKEVPELRGIIPNSFAHIFGHIAKCGEGVQFLVRVSYLEIYKEEVRDLLSKNHSTRLEVRERVDVGVYVKDLTSFVVKSPEEMDKLMFIGDKNRMVGPTDMNEHSSRSHTIFTITVERSEMGPDHQQHIRMGKLHLVDLAGSERQTKTNATGDRLKEAIQINLSLSTLGNVISALVDGKSTHIPYRNSKLTRLLQDSLGGNSKTIMIANIGPANYNSEETLNTLRYASRAKSIQNKAHINEDPKDAMLREFQKEIEELRKKLEEEGANGVDPQGGAKDQSSGGGGLTPQHAAALRAKIEQERLELLGKKDLAQSERDKAQQELERRENEIKKAQEQHDALEQKLAALQNKVIVGGVNLLEKAEEQERLLEESEKKLVKRRKREEELRQQLKLKEAERQDIEGKYASLQDEAVAKTAKLKEIWKQFQAAKEELADMKAEFQRENEDTLESIRQTSRELKLQLVTINHFIPKEYQDLLDAHVVWHEDTGEWHVQGVAYAGNNMKRQASPEHISTQQQFDWSDTSSAYLVYHIGSQEVHSLLPGTSDSSAGSTRAFKSGRKTSTERAKVTQRKASDGAKVQPVAEGEQQEYPTSRGLISRQKHFA